MEPILLEKRKQGVNSVLQDIEQVTAVARQHDLLPVDPPLQCLLCQTLKVATLHSAGFYSMGNASEIELYSLIVMEEEEQNKTNDNKKKIVEI